MSRALLGLLCAAAAALAADGPELRPLKGDKYKGDLVRLTDKEIVLKVGDKERALPTEQTLQLDFAPPASLRDAKFYEVELVDRSVLRASAISYKGKEATLTLLGGPTVQAPLASLASVLAEAHDLRITTDWKGLFAGKKRSYDAAVLKGPTGKLNALEGTFGDASDDGKEIAFTPRGRGKTDILLERLHGMNLLRPPDPNLPPLLGKFHDTHGGVVMAKSIAYENGKLVAVAQCGVRVAYDLPAVAKLDYSKGKLTHLSDIELSRVKVTDNSDFTRVLHYRKDTNLDGEGPIRIAGQTYNKGLAMHAHCEIVFDLEGEYREFKAIVGVDDRVGQATDGPTTLRIEGDGKELLTLAVTRKDGAKPVALNVIDVQKLKIVVSSDDVLGLGRHLALGDAKVSK